jgi:hypothetical protein
MASIARALIIACENYRRADDVAQKLEGTLIAGTAFYEWLVTTKKVDVCNIYICCDDSLIPAHPPNLTFRSDRGSILTAVDAICQAGRNSTTELLVFFSGHGVGYQVAPQLRGVDVLLASDYRNRRLSGASCIKFDELRTEMRGWLGGQDHYYFLDACRTVMNASEIQPTGLGLTLPLADSKDPTAYVLYAARFGEPAGVNSGFAVALMNGLKGTGRAKRGIGGKWFVQFERVQKFVQEHVRVKTDLVKEGPREGLLLELTGKPTSSCTITVENAADIDKFALTVEVSGLQQTFDFSGGSFQKDLVPSDDGYQFNLTKGDTAYQLIDPPLERVIDLFDATALRFRQPIRTMRGTPPPAPPQRSGIGVPPLSEAVPNLSVQVRRASTREIVAQPVVPTTDTQWIPLPPGDYIAELTERGRVVRRAEVRLAPNERKPFELLLPPASRVQRSIAARLPKQGGLPDVSGTLLGPLVDQDTSMWLSILGGSRLIDQPSNFSKLGPLALATFEDLQPGESAVYALAGLESGERAMLGISTDANVHWRPMDPAAGLSGVFHLRDRRQPGPVLVSFAVPGMPPMTYATYALPNRAALIVFDVKRTGHIVTRQMLLPVNSLQQFLDPIVRERFNEERLSLVKYLTIAQELFANRQSLDPGTPDEQARWDSLLYGKWIDPLLGVMTIFDALRRGRTQEARTQLAQATANLNQFFGELPDVAAASQALGLPSRPPAGTPLLLESLQRVPELKNTLPLKADFLDYSSMWTSWWGAVAAPGN